MIRVWIDLSNETKICTKSLPTFFYIQILMNVLVIHVRMEALVQIKSICTHVPVHLDGRDRTAQQVRKITYTPGNSCVYRWAVIQCIKKHPQHLLLNIIIEQCSPSIYVSLCRSNISIIAHQNCSTISPTFIEVHLLTLNIFKILIQILRIFSPCEDS